MASGKSKKINNQSRKINENSDDSTDEISIKVEKNQNQKSSENYSNKPLNQTALNKKNNLIFSDNEEGTDQNFSDEDDFSEVDTYPTANKKNNANNNSIHNANNQKNYVNNNVTQKSKPIIKKQNQPKRDATPVSVFTIEESIASPLPFYQKTTKKVTMAQKDKLRDAREIRRPSPDLDSVAL